MTLQRYDQATVQYGIGECVDMVTSENGYYVEYDDLAAALAPNDNDQQYIREAKIVISGLLLSPINWNKKG